MFAGYKLDTMGVGLSLGIVGRFLTLKTSEYDHCTYNCPQLATETAKPLALGKLENGFVFQ
jgi:hypothetical protein